MRGRVTVQKIADMTGVSKYAVSRALSGKSGVSAKTREMILRAAGQLGYFSDDPGKLPADLADDYNRNKVTGTIVVLFPNVRYQNNESVYWGPIFDGIKSRLNQRGLDFLSLTEPSRDNVFSLLNPNAVQGIITVGSISTTILLEMHRFQIPVVMVDHEDPAFRCDTIFTDNFSCMRDLIAKLISRGYRDFQFLGDIGDAPSFFERYIAFKTGLEQHGIPYQPLPQLIGPEAKDVGSLMAAFPEDDLPEVLVCVNDSHAQFAIEALENRDIHIPQRCAVTGFDNAFENLPLLATVDVNKELLGMRAVDQIVWRMNNRDTSFEKKLIYGDVIIRDQFAYVPNA
ncbi:LacI family transcriptional regulator [Paenibacillus nanensis]|uniref:LacI family transcriptional regulator n=1 Tax=Paenibacillus nanensis TaxID=393251 RepID=A0A3A1VML6_9BACL|nr:LacI family DNA-binding transcriptional regulator [Paenibacillus nanensis]RIX59763.1 LacI family transcriptional regulator [Paenibacillus nanensis]